MRKLTMALVATVGLLIGNGAGAVTIDFESFSHGDVVSGMTISGVTILVTNPHQPFDLGIAFDTTMTGTRDDDLEAGSPAWKKGNLAEKNLGFDPQLGKVLIIQENNTGCELGVGTCSLPDDQAGGGVFDFAFQAPITSFGFDLIDIDSDETGGMITLYSGMNSRSFRFDDLLDPTLFGNRSANRFAPLLAEELGIGAFDRVTVQLISSGGIDNLTFAPVPEPGSLAMLALGLVGLASFRRETGK